MSCIGLRLEGVFDGVDYYQEPLLPINQLLIGNKKEAEYIQKTLLFIDSSVIRNSIETNYEFKFNEDAFRRINITNFLE